ncbi:MAG: hypothetical protein LBM09_02255 [Candidatus Nomurabacteria bacterium]|jgi:hypothetical protein|nr:hypothetical protein [Candidatus Nomurabacteria bacterium]
MSDDQVKFKRHCELSVKFPLQSKFHEAENFFWDKDYIKISDDQCFAKITDAAIIICNKNYSGNHRQGMIPMGNVINNTKCYAWFPQLAIVKNGKFIAPTKSGWENTISDDGKTIIEVNADYKNDHNISPNVYRVVFMKDIENNSYKFIGVFQEKSTFRQNHQPVTKVYEQVDDKFKIIR